MDKISVVFDVEYPRTMVLNKQILAPQGINFVSAKGTNNGISARIKENKQAKKYKAGVITVALKGSVMSAFLQLEDFYIAHQTAVLYPKTKLTDAQFLYYCMCLNANKYKFSFGRQADRTLKEIIIPSISEIPTWVNDIDLHKYHHSQGAFNGIPIPELNISTWNLFNFQELFIIRKGKRLTKAKMVHGSVPFIGSIDSNNGLRQYISQKSNHEGNTITVNYNGSVGEVFYQPKPFWASDDVNVLYPKFQLNQYIGMFIATMIKKEKFRFNYGRKWEVERMKNSTVKLPTNKDGQPDWQFMENYIKSLPYSSNL